MNKNTKSRFILSILFVLICLEPSWPALSVALNEDIPSSEVSGHNNSIVNSLTGPNDRRPPDIELMGISDNQTVYTEKIYIAGHVIDENTIKALTLNKSSILNSPARKIFFSHLVEIKEGSNRITIEAVDKAGNRAREDITVVRRKGQHLQLPAEVAARRLRVALYPFEKSGAVSAESVPFLDLLTLDLQTQNRFQLVDRSYMDRILEEQNFSLSKLIDRNAAVKLGKLMSAQAIITGNIVETPDGTEVVGRMIDTETSEILAMEKIYSYQKGIAALSFLAESLSVKFHNDFPMLSGIIIKHKDGHLYTDLGKGKISPHGRLIVYRSNKSDKGASSLKVTIMGYARVTEILPDMSKAEFFSGNPDEIRVMDKVAVQ